MSEIRPTEATDEKYADEQNEDIGLKREDHAIAIMPESIRGLSDAERDALEKKVVRKMDLVVL